MSNGPCECVAAPASNPEPMPDVPMPRSERDTLTALPQGPPRATPVLGPDQTSLSIAGRSRPRTAGKTHNEIRALLGIWRT